MAKCLLESGWSTTSPELRCLTLAREPKEAQERKKAGAQIWPHTRVYSPWSLTPGRTSQDFDDGMTLDARVKALISLTRHVANFGSSW